MCIQFHPICSKNKKKSVSYPRQLWSRLWKQCTKLHGITRRTFWIVKEVHSFQSDSLFVTKPDLGGEFIKKVIESQYIGHFLIISQIIVISLILGSKLKLSVILRKIIKNYHYRKIWIISHPLLYYTTLLSKIWGLRARIFLWDNPFNYYLQRLYLRPDCWIVKQSEKCNLADDT